MTSTVNRTTLSLQDQIEQLLPDIALVPLSPLVTIGDGDYDDLDGRTLSSSPPASTTKHAAPPTGAIRLARLVFSTSSIPLYEGRCCQAKKRVARRLSSSRMVPIV